MSELKPVVLFSCRAERPRYDDDCPCYVRDLDQHDQTLPHGQAWSRLSGSARRRLEEAE